MDSGKRAVIFDVGNVLFQWDRNAMYAPLIKDDQARRTFLDEVVSLDWHAQHDLGVPFAETSAELRARFPDHAALINLYGPRFNDSLQNEVPGIVAVLESLDAAAVPLYAITNFHHEFFAAFRASRPDVFGRFRDIVVSGEEKLIKPDTAIYTLALDRFGVEAEDAVFVDDLAANVAAADSVGMTGLLFTDAVKLRADLAELGLPG